MSDVCLKDFCHCSLSQEKADFKYDLDLEDRTTDPLNFYRFESIGHTKGHDWATQKGHVGNKRSTGRSLSIAGLGSLMHLKSVDALSPPADVV
ncbi:hypothetical protein TNCV_5057861 [Trichonephila clavipes]|nr:hypothetical protein TNCV_5057861 [Trichonephila clavipes]